MPKWRPWPQPEHLPCAVACYALTDLDMARLTATRQLYVRALGETHPPISVHASNPITFTAPGQTLPDPT